MIRAQSGNSFFPSIYRRQHCKFVGIAQQTVGLIALADTLRDNARATIAQIHAGGVKNTLLTGDNSPAASYIAQQVGITEVRWQLLPEDKVSAIQNYEAVANEPI